ncbi:MAG: DNA-formamidopyrimidine glycosylase [bacterium]
MPELPEVETVRKQLEKEILGAEIVEIEVRDARCFENAGKIITSEMVTKIMRVGKYIFVVFESGRGLQIHLKMTGRLVIEQKNKNIEYSDAPHTRVVMKLKAGGKIYYWDTRMFGYIKVVEDVSADHQKLKQKLGPEPWDITDIDLLRKLQKTGRSIKEAILDQNMLAGVGNIYANDGLWLAGIDPRRKANSLKLTEVAKLRQGLCSVLERGLYLGGASDNTYRDFYGGRGGYQNEFLVYGRTGEPCNNCGRSLKRIVVGGRGTWMCEECQK